MSATGKIFDIYRGTSHDGPGLRTTVFFQGCPLKCQWCHNPEGLSSRPTIWWDEKVCIGCMSCAAACTRHALKAEEDGMHILDEKCVQCGSCVQACPTGAMSFVGREWTVDALFHEVMKDDAYYRKTGGGVTASGGECLLQREFLTEFFSKLSFVGVDCAVDTCGHVPWAALESVLPFTRHVLYDLKLADRSLHRQYTGQGNEVILENARRLNEYCLKNQTNCEVWIRTPLIPGITASKENLSQIAAFIREELSACVTRWELPAFNNSCIRKYCRLRQEWSFAKARLIQKAEAEKLLEFCYGCGLPKNAIVVTGLLAE